MEKREIYTASRFYKEKFSCKVYKISLDSGCTCPNRDGTKGKGGCIFCSEKGSGDFVASRNLSIEEQIAQGKLLIASKIKNPEKVKYIAYFQSFSSTYGDSQQIINKIIQAISNEFITGISIATRPDSMNEEILHFLSEIAEKYFVSIELGLQTSNEKTGMLINRCYTDKDFIEAVAKIRSFSPKIHIVTHLIFGLPGESKIDMIESVKFCINCGIDGLKFTVLYVLKNTELEKMYYNNEFKTLSMNEYFEILYEALQIVPPKVVIHRLTGDGPKSILIAPLWTADKKAVHNRMKEFFLERNQIL